MSRPSCASTRSTSRIARSSRDRTGSSGTRASVRSPRRSAPPSGPFASGCAFYSDNIGTVPAAIGGTLEGDHHGDTSYRSVRSRKEPNAPVELGYRTAVAAHMASLAYRQKERITFNTATSTS
ncbi:MAG: hypothetical protein DMF92_21720 [Acidobacteria bacterium]|nr:MAG: hypothetical protein DMF92_21720 [Acidobacteriota bacterium]